MTTPEQIREWAEMTPEQCWSADAMLTKLRDERRELALGYIAWRSAAKAREAECESLNTQARAAEQLLFEARAARDALAAALADYLKVICWAPGKCSDISDAKAAAALDAHAPGWRK